jgi:hypothetical protein
MKKVSFIFILIALVDFAAFSQRGNFDTGRRGQGRGGMEEEQVEEVPIKQEIKVWKLIDDYTFADTIPLDTATTGFQIHNPIYKYSISNISTGNLGSPYLPEIISDRKWRNEFIFYNSLQYYFPRPEDVIFYNTRTPYTNLIYGFGGPKRRSEESVGVLFTQNVNKNFNVGLKYMLYSPVGHYEAQNLRNQTVRLFASYTGEKYSVSGVFMFASASQSENGGIINDDFLLNEDQYGFEQPENIPVNFTTATNDIKNFQVFLTQSLGLGKIKVKKKEKGKEAEMEMFQPGQEENMVIDSLMPPDTMRMPPFRADSLMNRYAVMQGMKDEEEDEIAMPVSTVYYTLNYEHDKRVYFIDNLPQYMDTLMLEPYYSNMFVDSLLTADSVKYHGITNTFQLKLNEEANSLLKFGVRAFISNSIRYYSMPAAPYYEPGDLDYIPYYRTQDTILTTSHFGGQIFKNLGKKFWWNAGFKMYFQGYRAGDMELTGKINSRFKVSKKDTAGIFADGGFYTNSPEFFQNKYFSNQFQWDNKFRAQKMIRLRGGIKVPTRRLELMAELRSMNDYIFWNNDALPEQASDFVQTLEISLSKYFKWANVHSINKLVYQATSNANVIPLPDFAAYSSNFYQNRLFQVLTFQIGFDFRYHTRYYAPTYMPATGQFHTQNIRKIGNYPFFDAFVNFQLKRARIYVKLDHATQGLFGNDYFLTTGYPANPRSIKFGISWNFYN